VAEGKGTNQAFNNTSGCGRSRRHLILTYTPSMMMPSPKKPVKWHRSISRHSQPFTICSVHAPSMLREEKCAK